MDRPAQFLLAACLARPGSKTGTLLLTSNLPFYSSTDNSLSAAINWIYAQI